MKGSFTIEASLLVPLTIMVMIFAIKSGVTLYEETKEQVELLEEQKTSDIIKLMYWTKDILDMKEIFYESKL